MLAILFRICIKKNVVDMLLIELEFQNRNHNKQRFMTAQGTRCKCLKLKFNWNMICNVMLLCHKRYSENNYEIPSVQEVVNHSI